VAPTGASGHQAQLSHLAQQGSEDPTIYDSTVAPLPGNLPSESFESTETSALGNQVTFAGAARELKNVVVTMSSWGCENGIGITPLAPRTRV
jgi:hypothetical protein